jgi:hypothetical protein
MLLLQIFFIRRSKSQVSIDSLKNLLSYGKLMIGGHFDFVRHFVFAPFFNGLNYQYKIGNLRGFGKILKN